MKKIWTVRIRSRADIRMVNDFIGVLIGKDLEGHDMPNMFSNTTIPMTTYGMENQNHQF